MELTCGAVGHLTEPFVSYTLELPRFLGVIAHDGHGVAFLCGLSIAG